MQHNTGFRERRAIRNAIKLSANRQGGFSLIELMLALTLGLVVTAGIVQLFVGNNRTTQLITGQSRLQESARYALDFISRSARNAGFYGCDPEEGKLYSTINSDWEDMFEYNLLSPIEGFDGTGAGNSLADWTPTLTSLPRTSGGSSFNTIIPGNGIDVSTIVPGTDLLAVRYMLAPGEQLAQQVGTNDDPVIEDDGDVTIQAGDFALISNCEQAALFRVTAVSAGAGGITLSRGTGVGIFENSGTQGLSEQGVPYGGPTSNEAGVVAQVLTDVYFVADGAGTNNRGTTTTALWRKSGTNAPVELVEGISDMQILYGIDTTPNDGIPSANQYVGPGAIGNNVIRSVRVSVEANTVDVVSDSAEPIARTFTQTISIRNGRVVL